MKRGEMTDTAERQKVYIETFATIRLYVKDLATGQQINMKPYLNAGNKLIFDGVTLLELSPSTGSLYSPSGFNRSTLEKFLREKGFDVVEKKAVVRPKADPKPSTLLFHG